jgi:hypothetical protein
MRNKSVSKYVRLISALLENVWQRQQHRFQGIFNKISLQEMFLHLQEIFAILYTGYMPYNLLIFPKNSKNGLQIEIALCQDKSL